MASAKTAHRWAFTWAVVALLAMTSLSPVLADEIGKGDVLDWVDQLDAPSLSQRKRAEQALIEAGQGAGQGAGQDILEWIPTTNAGLTVEAADRLDRVRKALQEVRTKKDTEVQLARIRLNKVSNLGEALEAISRDSGVEFEHEADDSMAIRPVATPLPFWHALDLVLDAADLDINFYGGGEGTLLLQKREKHRPSRVDSAAYAGVYRIEPTSITARRNLSNPDLSGLNVSIHIAWQPTTTPIGLTIPVAQLSGRLDDSAVLKPQASGDTIDVATNRDLAFSEFFLPMQLPADQPRKISSLSGLIQAMLPGKQESFELSLGETATAKTVDALTVTVEEVRQNGPLHEIRLGVELKDADRSLESHRHWIFENDAYVQRKDGSRADHLGYQVYRQTASGIGLSYLFDLGDTVGESTLIYTSPTAVIQNEVPFVIQDIPLP